VLSSYYGSEETPQASLYDSDVTPSSKQSQASSHKPTSSNHQRTGTLDSVSFDADRYQRLEFD
jgi:hypothetical protein